MPTVLIVEDDAAIRLLLDRALARKGYETVIAVNGNEAIAAIDSFTLNAVLLDLMIPGIFGIDVLRHIRQKRPALIPCVIVVTAMARRADLEMGELDDLGGVIVKPFDILHLFEVLDACVHCAAELDSAGSGPNPAALGDTSDPEVPSR
jgi:CheY-like chemotaxis protein